MSLELHAEQIQPAKSYAEAYRKSKRSIRRLIESNDAGWPVYGSPIRKYERTFAGVLENKGIASLVKDRKSPFIIDVMGPSDTLVDLFTQLPQSDKTGLAITLLDNRTEEQKQRDETLHIEQLSADITKSKSWRAIEQILAGRKADLIMERGYGGLLRLPEHRDFYATVLQRLWGMTSKENGVLLLELPLYLEWIGVTMDAWASQLEAKNIKHKRDTSALFLRRAPDSPDQLPMLGAVQLETVYQAT